MSSKIQIPKFQNQVIWVLVSTTSNGQAEKIGRAILEQRLCACFGIYPRLKSMYFWPPKSNRLEQSQGPLLVLETLPKHAQKISQAVKKLHGDQAPFIGSIKVDNISPEFLEWMLGEIK